MSYEGHPPPSAGKTRGGTKHKEKNPRQTKDHTIAFLNLDGKPCARYKNGRCPYNYIGANGKLVCEYTHDMHQMNGVLPTCALGEDGNCTLGHACLYAHGKDDPLEGVPAEVLDGAQTQDAENLVEAAEEEAAAENPAPEAQADDGQQQMDTTYAPPSTLAPAYTPVYALTFDSTLGYPGEGPPATIVSLNINGAKHKLAGVLDRLARARVDVLLLQEIHYYNDNWHREPLRALCLAKRWDLFLSPPGPNDTGGGTAVLVYQDSQSVKPIAGTLRTAPDGRLASVQVNINDIKTEITSVYLSAQAAPRRNQIKKIKDDRLIKRESIVGGDFNCVTSSNLDVAHYNNQTVYANTGGREWAALTAHLGLVDTHRQFHGNKRGGYTRITPTVATRIDRLYASKYNTHWRWTHVAPDDTLLPINTTDHLPLVAKVETAPPRPPSEHEMKIDVSLYEENWVRGLVTKTWISLEAERPQDQFGAGEAYSHAKQGVAKLLRDLTNKKRKNKYPTTLIKKQIQFIIQPIDALGPSPALLARRDHFHSELHKVENARKMDSKTAYNTTQHEERMSTQFFKRFKSRLANSDISSLHITPDWDNPDQRNGIATDTPKVVEELTNYYSHLFAPKPSEEPEPLLEALRAAPLSNQERDLLEQEITHQEVEKALDSMAKGKAPGPDGLGAEFYHKFKTFLTPRLLAVFKEAQKIEALPEDLTSGDVTILYKKGDTRDVRNYRPITLLQVDYEIYAKILVSRMKKVLDSFVSPEQLGFVPGRLITEATHLGKLMQAYLDETDEPGMILALDWEKAFDRCSWEYLHSATEALHFGPVYRGMMRLLSNPDAPPKRRVKVNGTRGDEFLLQCGVPQGCPFSPLAFLIVAEALTRLIKNSTTFKGTQIGAQNARGEITTARISQFADDTNLFPRSFEDLKHVWPILTAYEKATAMRANVGKFIGIPCGRLKRTPIPSAAALGPTGALVQWLAPNHYSKLLGVPFWTSGSEDQFWRDLYNKIKTRLASWKHLGRLTATARQSASCQSNCLRNSEILDAIYAPP